MCRHTHPYSLVLFKEVQLSWILNIISLSLTFISKISVDQLWWGPPTCCTNRVGRALLFFSRSATPPSAVLTRHHGTQAPPIGALKAVLKTNHIGVIYWYVIKCPESHSFAEINRNIVVSIVYNFLLSLTLTLDGKNEVCQFHECLCCFNPTVLSCEYQSNSSQMKYRKKKTCWWLHWNEDCIFIDGQQQERSGRLAELRRRTETSEDSLWASGWPRKRPKWLPIFPV